ncbi:hypothetical protein LNJ06_01655 [Tenacibaculum finnmarkense genomovar ulcerans]|uniref:hypothetical protein n=2 Tax=Tenacibaculum finnmarkense TaxID=2781243 RepID=UPI001E4C68D8|nr:hypothetical protein [Tenacibaculum finnmarkense]MCD8428885.1 hypothetical protein [Tenacibaculum finnmarkense genomovar ulcerans]
MKHQENVKKWFETHDKPSQKQFYNFFKWIRWIDENISVQDIEGLNKLLIAKADKQAFNTHLQDEILHPSENDRENWNGKLDKTGTAVNSLKLGNHPPEYYAKKDHNHDDIYQLKNEENGAFISSQKLLEPKTGKALFPELKGSGISLSINSTGSTGYPYQYGSSVHFFFGSKTEGSQNLKLRAFTLWKDTRSNTLYHQGYGDNGVATGFKKIFNEDNLQKSDVDKLNVDAATLNGELPAFYANSATTYSKVDVDNAILTSMNEVVQMLLNNPDVEVNSIKELLAEMNTADNALIASIANKVSYVVSQNLTQNQKNIAQANIGIFNTFLKLSGGKVKGDVAIENSRIFIEKTGGSKFGFAADNLGMFIYDYIRGGLAVRIKNDKDVEFYGVTSSLGGFKVGDKEVYHSGNLPKQTVKPLSSVTTYTAKASDAGSIVPLNNANTEIILNTASFPRIGDTAKYFYKGTGTCKVARSGTANELKNINDTLEFDGQNSMIEITKTGANEYFICGQLIRA